MSIRTRKNRAARIPMMAMMSLQSADGGLFQPAATIVPPSKKPRVYYRARKIGAVIFPVDAERETGYRRYSNEEVAEKAAANSDVLIPFASIDPAKGKTGASEARRLIRDFGIRGFKFHPSMQGFYPNDRSAYVLYEAIAEASSRRCSIPDKPASVPA